MKTAEIKGWLMAMAVIIMTVSAWGLFAAEKITAMNSQTQDELRSALAKSYQSEWAFKYDEAVKALNQVYKANPQNYLINYRIGYLYYMLGSYEYSKGFYQNAIKASPESLEARTACMLPVLALGKYSEADDLAKQVLSEDPGNYYANLRYAYSLRMQQKYDQADKVAMKLRKMYPTDTTVLTEVALAKWGMKDLESAKAAFNEILNISSDNKYAKSMLETLSGGAGGIGANTGMGTGNTTGAGNVPGGGSGSKDMKQKGKAPGSNFGKF